MKETINKPLINWILIIQGWAMLWVVIGHSCLGNAGEGPVWENALFNIAYSFHMPLFMLISGYLFHYTRLSKLKDGKCGGWYKSMISNKVKRLMIPYVFFTFVAFLLKMAFPGEMARLASINLQEVINAFIYPYDNPLREMWFIATLMWFFLIMPFWGLVIKRQWTKWLALAGLLVLHFFHPDTEFLCIGRVLSYALWFYLGIFISEGGYINKLTGRNRWIAFLAGAILYAAGFFTSSFFETIGGIVISISLALTLDEYLPKTFKSFRNFTYQIFLMGIFAQMFVKILFRHQEVPYLPAYIICLLMGLYLPVMVSKILQKINWTPLLYCVGLSPSRYKTEG